jgi:rod shape determining protein RodA
MREQKSIFSYVDWTLVALFIMLVILGWLSIHSSVYNEAHSSLFDTQQRYGKQFLWICGSVVLILAIMTVDGRLFQKSAPVVYLITLALLILVLFFGKKVSGARSWFEIGGFSLQPSEFAKFSTSLMLAYWLSLSPTFNLRSLRNTVISFLIVFLPALIILPQPDAGSAIVYTSFILVLHRFGLNPIFLWGGFALAALFLLSLVVPTVWLISIIGFIGVVSLLFTRRKRKDFIRVVVYVAAAVAFTQSVDYSFNNLLEDRHRNRINILLGKAHDPQGIGYNTEQSKIAIGSGGFFGKGYLKGTQTKFDFVPEQSTDFIFCTVGEEFGFVGSAALVLLFTFLIIRIFMVAERQRSQFSKVYGYCVGSIILFHFAINIAMTIGLAPVVGIPLPFLSYGGSALWGFTILLFIFIKLDAYRMQIL